MAELHEALKQLGPVDWSDVPQDGLEQYLTEAFTAGELICNSIPQIPNGTPFAESKPHHHIPNFAKSHKDIHASEARQHPPVKEHADLSKHWGKPIKLKDNPLQVSLYKMAGHDRHGAWFARRSVHEGLGFDKWKRAMLREFSETMAVKGGPGAGAIRGLAADRRVEKKAVDGVGQLEVYQLSAQFPGPVTPRDFVEMLMGTDDALSHKSAAELESGKHVPRHLMVISKPVDHPDTPERSGFVRGHYESVEMIREIPLSPAKAKSTSDLPSGSHDSDHATRERGHTVAASTPASATDSHDPELNPVEWIMITRSDPGGGIPRFLVERGTPETMIADVHKFFNWACSQERIADPDEDLEQQEKSSEEATAANGTEEHDKSVAAVDGSHQARTTTTTTTPAAADTTTQPATESNGVITSLGKAIGAGIDTYAPVSVSNMMHERLGTPRADDSSDDSSDASSIDSFLSAEEMTRVTTAPELPAEMANDSVDAFSVASGDVSESSNFKNLNHHDKEIQKLSQKREKLDQQLAKKRMAEEAKLKQSQEKEEKDEAKAREEMEKRLKKTEEKHKKEIEKLEHKKAKEQKKAEERRRKKDDSNKLSLVTRERDEFRSQSDLFKRENALLREQVAELQAQNNILAQKLGNVGGQEVLKSVQDEIGHGRTKSMKSIGSGASSESILKGIEKNGDSPAAS